jgi:streptogramin lyase
MPQSKSGTYRSMSTTRIGLGHRLDGQRHPALRSQDETYESFPSDKKSANVRQMLGRPGEAWGGESGTDRLVVIRD